MTLNILAATLTAEFAVKGARFVEVSLRLLAQEVRSYISFLAKAVVSITTVLVNMSKVRVKVQV